MFIDRLNYEQYCDGAIIIIIYIIMSMDAHRRCVYVCVIYA